MSSSIGGAHAHNDPESLDDDSVTNESVSSDETDLNCGGTQPQVSGSSSHNRNPLGFNQHGGRVPPLDDTFKGYLREYNQNNITSWAEIMRRLADDHGIKIGRSKLGVYMKEAGVGTSRRKLMSPAEQTQHILDELENDPRQSRGPRNIKESLGLRGLHISRPVVETVMRDFVPEGFKTRKPGHKKIRRTPLTSLGSDDEWSLDGFDKMVKAGFAIYGIRCKWSGRYLHYVVVPSNRYAAVVGVLFLQCVKKYGGIPIQVTSDRGSEVRDAYSAQHALREHFAPDLIDALIPSWTFVPSPRNITVERAWRPLFIQFGQNILDFYYAGRHAGTFEPNNVVHQQTSNWIWFPLVQRELDAWTTRQNDHRIRKQSKKSLPSGGRPNDFYRYPEDYGGKRCLIEVDMAIIDQLLEESQEGNELMRYVEVDFEPIAVDAWTMIGEPVITLNTAWRVFDAMIARIIST